MLSLAVAAAGARPSGVNAADKPCLIDFARIHTERLVAGQRGQFFNTEKYILSLQKRFPEFTTKADIDIRQYNSRRVVEMRAALQRQAQANPQKFERLFQQVRRNYLAILSRKNRLQLAANIGLHRGYSVSLKRYFDLVLNVYFDPARRIPVRDGRVKAKDFVSYINEVRARMGFAEQKDYAESVLRLLQKLHEDMVRQKDAGGRGGVVVMGSFISGLGNRRLGSDIDLARINGAQVEMQEFEGYPISATHGGLFSGMFAFNSTSIQFALEGDKIKIRLLSATDPIKNNLNPEGWHVFELE